MNLLPSVVVLGTAALAALLLAANRGSPADAGPERAAAARALAVALGVQIVHFAEETATGLPERLGPLFGLEGMPLAGFIAFNVTWIVLWVASVPGLRSARPAAFFAAWFLAIAGVVNGIAHPLLAIAAGGYFPGLATSPLSGIAGAWLGFRLHRATRPRGTAVHGARPASRSEQPGRSPT